MAKKKKKTKVPVSQGAEAKVGLKLVDEIEEPADVEIPLITRRRRNVVLVENPEATLDLGADTIVVDPTLVTPTRAPRVDEVQNPMRDTTDVSAKDESVDLNLSTQVLAGWFLVSFVFCLLNLFWLIHFLAFFIIISLVNNNVYLTIPLCQKLLPLTIMRILTLLMVSLST